MSWVAWVACAWWAGAPVGPLEPEAARRTMRVTDGLVVELMASEPLVRDPVAFAFGPDGALWVVEMGDYPLGAGDTSGGRVKRLTRSTPTGPFDRAQTFLDRLRFPTGVFPWKKGVLVVATPEIFYAEDVDGDGAADVRDVLYSGFVEGNQQHRVNGLVWGLDGWLYGANGDSGGTVKSHKTGKTVDIRGRDFRIRPETGDVEATSGQTQFGRCRDDFGTWFGCNNSNPLYHFVLEDHYLRRNPHVAFGAVKSQAIPGAVRVYPTSVAPPRFNDFHTLNHFTSACSAHVYRDSLMGPTFANAVFICEPVHNLIHRAMLTPSGATYLAPRVPSEKASEFLTSTDNWCRPVFVTTGPDGAVWFADMYRHVIEHPQWIPKEWQAKLDLRAGHDRGRIYRVRPANVAPRSIPAFDDVVSLFDHPNGWVRDTAHRLALERRTPAIESGVRALAARKTGTLGELHAVHAVVGWDGPSGDGAVGGGFADPRARAAWVRAHEGRAPLARELAEAGVNDAGLRVQVALSCGADPASGPALAKLLASAPSDTWLSAAVWSSLGREQWPGFVATLDAQRLSPAWATSLAKIARGYGHAPSTARLVGLLVGDGSDPSRWASAEALVDALDLAALARDPAGADAAASVARTLDLSRRIASDPKAPLGDRAIALTLLGRDSTRLAGDRETLAGFLSPQTPDDLQAAALARLGEIPDSAPTVIAVWKRLGPTQRAQALDAFLARPAGVEATLVALERGSLIPSDFDAVRRQRLVSLRDLGQRARATKALDAPTSSDRAKVVDAYRAAAAQPGDAGTGAKVFAQRCAACHPLGELGAGPDLRALGDKSDLGLLTAIFDPNRAVEPRYVSYLLTTKAGLALTGAIAAESSAAVSLALADGKRRDTPRAEIDELTSTGKSLMPEGLERDLSPRDVSDLFAFLRREWSAPGKARKE